MEQNDAPTLSDFKTISFGKFCNQFALLFLTNINTVINRRKKKLFKYDSNRNKVGE